MSVEAFERGLSQALDPANRLMVEGGQGITTLYSPWLHKLCPVCKHSFRLDDEAVLSSNGIARHNTLLLPCAGGATDGPPQTSAATAFFRGLDAAWPPPQNLPLRRLEEGDPLLALPPAGLRRHKCAVCGHTLRLHDVVVICPCQPQNPLCQIAIHRDPAHNLSCWEEWKPDAYDLYCPATSRKIAGQPVL